MRRRKTWTSLRSTWSSFHQGLQCTTSLLQYLLCTSSMRGTWSSFHQGLQYTSLLQYLLYTSSPRGTWSSFHQGVQCTSLLQYLLYTSLLRGTWSSSHQGLQCTSLPQLTVLPVHSHLRWGVLGLALIRDCNVLVYCSTYCTHLHWD